MRQVLVWLWIAILPCFALHQSDAGKIDWHKEQIGIPRTESLAVAPKFQLVAGPIKRSVVITVSKNNVLAAVNAPDGALAWRHILDPFDLIGIYRSNPEFVVALSGPGGATLRSYNVSNGDLVYESQLHSPLSGKLHEPPNIGEDIIFSIDKTNDVFALTNAHVVRRVDGISGQPKWTWTSEDQTSSVLYSKLVMTESTIYVIGLTKSFKSYTLHVVSLDATTGAQLSSTSIDSSINNPSEFIVLTSAKSPNPILSWFNEGHIHTLTLNPKMKNKVVKLKDTYREIIDTATSDAGIFVASKEDGTSHVMRITKGHDSVESIWEFENADGADSKSIYIGGFDWSAQPYIGRYYYSQSISPLQFATFQVLAVNGPDNKVFLTGFRFPYDPSNHGPILHVHLYPSTPASRSHFSDLASNLYFAAETPDQRLAGRKILSTPKDGAFGTVTTWSASIDPSERVQAVIRRPYEPVASIGKVLGDRRTLYKYLNNHLMAVLTASKTVPARCGVYLVDGAKGTVLYHASLPSVGGVCDTHAALTENWLVYHYYDEGSAAKDNAKGYRLVSVELYEGSGIDDKTKSADLTSYSYASSLVAIFQRSFVFPTGVTALAMTSTKFGISTKDLIVLIELSNSVANTHDQIQSIPRRLLDPRRPSHKPSAQEQEEWLIQYDPVIPYDPRRVVSHTYQVAGASHIVTSPALLESTSIIFVYGLDLFLTRVAPSNTFDILSESFNKVQLVLTIIALGSGVMITRPMVRKKILKQKWYFS
ncbi:hypothetical protein M422DRAFT_56525 [Sphaerobolus stellatus SS14]|uniref:ER membrane protein complex subunit 1 n=1 Tax=Sphaerobolus stellatus (strain SS14) TaxID=990650 RepID=A0A0C9U4U8_SPHS4|nr:hypothetical protein M422DRAFT_56525 [Sphaerobolus stellatus SS14]